MKFSIIGPGSIANKMAEAISRLDQIEPYAVGSRSYSRAKSFAEKWGFKHAYASYEELLNDPAEMLVYVATPHSFHYEHAKLCITHQKNVLVEKPFTVNAAQASELFKLAEDRGVFITEAMWTRYMPSRKIIDKLISSDVIGNVSYITANLAYNIQGKERLESPDLAGGALLDLGVYPINFALMFMRDAVKKVYSSSVISPRGVDLSNSITLHFENGAIACLQSSILCPMNRSGLIYGEKGYIEASNINNCSEIKVYKDLQLVDRITVPTQINGYEYEVLSCLKAINQRELECEEMPHSETLRVMKILDHIRSQWNMRYPCE